MARLALLSVSDKTGLVEFARKLVAEFKFDLISSGGTAQALKEAGIPVTKVADYTGFPEILGGRVKTLHPRIHGGILARRDVPQDVADLATNQIELIDLVVVNLYPFEETIALPNVTLAQAIEQIDIGGPTLIRAAAKNYAHLTVLCDPTQYDAYLGQLQGGEVSLDFRQESALKAFSHTSEYDRAIATYLLKVRGERSQCVAGVSERVLGGIIPPKISHPIVATGVQEARGEESLPQEFTLSGQLVQSLRYGENPHQAAAWYQTESATGWAAANQIQGKELSYNNLVDLEAARRIIAEFADTPAAAIIKHTNPCGIALGTNISEAYQKAFNADSISAFGGIVALNRPINAATATALTKTFLECVVAPNCEPEAKEILAAKSKLRVLTMPDLDTGENYTVRTIAGGFLVQAADDIVADTQQWQVVTQKQPTSDQLAELLFAWKVCKHVKSNAIVVTRDRTNLGVGAGQMNRVGSVKIALEQAGEIKDAVLASDGFFPFDDSVKIAAAAGITAIVQPGGSLRDQDSIKAANELNLVMVFTGIRHFLH